MIICLVLKGHKHIFRLITEEKPRYKLPDLEKYWKAVNADQEDFNAWTYLLQYVDSESDVEAAREAYDSFLSRYCYCYGYWRKYADYEKKKGSLEKCDEVRKKIFFFVWYFAKLRSNSREYY